MLHPWWLLGLKNAVFSFIFPKAGYLIFFFPLLFNTQKKNIIIEYIRTKPTSCAPVMSMGVSGHLFTRELDAPPAPAARRALGFRVRKKIR